MSLSSLFRTLPTSDVAEFNAYDLAGYTGVPIYHQGGQEATLRLIDACKVEPGSEVLDVGCGTGFTARLLGKRNARVTGIDISAQMVEEARSRCETKGITILQADALRLPFPDGHFDAVFAEAILMHLEIDAALAEWTRILRSGGWLGVNVLVASESYQKEANALSHEVYRLPFFLRDDSKLRAALESAGLQNIGIEKGFVDHSRPSVASGGVIENLRYHFRHWFVIDREISKAWWPRFHKNRELRQLTGDRYVLCYAQKPPTVLLDEGVSAPYQALECPICNSKRSVRWFPRWGGYGCEGCNAFLGKHIPVQ